MTEKELREIDFEIAEKVMGLKRVERDSSGFGWFEVGEFEGIPTYKVTPFYSTNIKLAFEVVEKLKDKFDFCIETSKVYENLYNCYFLEIDSDESYFDHARTVPLAICKAALKILED